MKTRAIYLMALATLCSQPALADKATSNLKADANLSATCTISANSLSFGSLILPLTIQTATSQMNVLCNKEAPYTIGLAYGGVYGINSQYNYRLSGYTGCGSLTICKVGYTTFDSSGTQIGGVTQWSTGIDVGGNTEKAKQLWINAMGCTWTGSGNMCNGKIYDYGVLRGAAKGDSVAYSIAVPNDPSKVWNAGNGSYTAVGTGEIQNISFTGKIVPSQSSSNYPAPDMYMDTVTANISF